MTSQSGKKVIFLDRDGTINEDSPTWWKVESFVLLDKVPEALQLLRETGFTLALITNQGGVGVGMYTEQDVQDVHKHMQALLRKSNAQLDVLAYCPHSREDMCSCRKPEPDMAKQIEAEIGPIDYTNSWMIGDKDSDTGFGHNIGVKTAIIKSGTYWQDESELEYKHDLVVKSLWEFAQQITVQEPNK